MCFLLVALTGNAVAQQPVLDLFEGGGLEETFFVAVGGEEAFELPLATNPDTANLVTDPGGLDRIEVQLSGASPDIEVEEILSTLPGVIRNIPAPHQYTFRLTDIGVLAPASNFSKLLETLTYASNLTADALSDPPRNITIIAYDEIGASDAAIANIVLLEENRQVPRFDQESYAAAIEENSVFGTIVPANISASDPDGFLVEYSLRDPTGVFAIESTTGVVTVANSSALDFETTPQFEVTVVATDTDPITRLSSEVSLVIGLTDANDNPPVFEQSTYTFEVVEEALQAPVGTVRALDVDTVGTLSYDFVAPTTGSIFVRNGDTGEITVRTTLDFETQTQYTFDMQVSDGIRLDFATVVVNVIDIADNRPVIFPTVKRIILNLDIPETDAYLTSGTGGPLTVDDDSVTLRRGVASVSVLRNGVVGLLFYGYFTKLISCVWKLKQQN